MKSIQKLNLFFVITSLLFSSLAYSGQSSRKIMAATAQDSESSILLGHEYSTGVVFSEISRTPRFSKNLEAQLRKLEAEGTASLIEAIRENSEEFGCTVEEAQADIRKCLSARAIEISERYEAKLNGRTVGYALYLDNNADAAIIQDGSWIIIYLDEKMKVVAIYSGQA